MAHRPVLVEQSGNATVLEGTSARFKCRIRSDMAVMVHWVRPGGGDQKGDVAADDYDRSNSKKYVAVSKRTSLQ